MTSKSKKTFYIIGTGSAGLSLLHDIKAKFSNSMIVFIDSNSSKSDTNIENIPVMAPIEHALGVLRPTPLTEVIIALPSAPRQEIRRIFSLLKQHNFTNIRILPSPLSSLDRPHLIQTQKIELDDLLSRETITLPDKKALSFLEGKRVLITGAGGSIGTELAIQLLFAKVSRLYLLGHGEYSIYQITKKLQSFQQRGVGEQTHCIPILCELTNESMVKHTLSKLKADVIFHTAAFKHVDLVEDNAALSIAVNIFGTKHMLKYAKQTEASHFVFLSTDKAVNPNSIYGASKLISEEITRNATSDAIHTSIMRFGNVLGSRGSVVPLFQEQIDMGGPITITSPHCTRYFMTVSEACSLTLYALQLTNTHDSTKCNQFILEMGAQIPVLEIAKQLLEFYGLEADKDIEISFIGLRPGEKISENLLTEGEIRTPSSIKHIDFLTKKSHFEKIIALPELLDKLHHSCFFSEPHTSLYGNTQYIIHCLENHIPSFTRQHHQPMK